MKPVKRPLSPQSSHSTWLPCISLCFFPRHPFPELSISTGAAQVERGKAYLTFRGLGFCRYELGQWEGLAYVCLALSLC